MARSTRAFALAERSAREPFHYPNPGFTRNAPDGGAPGGYRVDRTRVRLGQGEAVFERACRALSEGRMFELGWVSATKTSPGFSEGDVVVVAARLLGLTFLNVSRVAYTLREDARRFGFAYGTLRHHAERGEERFLVERDPADDSVWYELYAVSRPNRWWVWLGLPFARRAQRRFARDSLRAMERAVAGANPHD